MNFRKIALTKFLNDTPEELTPELFKWGEIHYQVIPYSQIRKFGYSFDSFVKIRSSGRFYGIREMSKELLRKYYYSYYLTLQ